MGEYKVKCKECSGHYVVRAGMHGLFGGCSCFPDCRSTVSLKELLRQYFDERGIRIYCWDQKCRWCGKNTKYYSYYINLQLARDVSEVFDDMIIDRGIGDILAVDEILANEIESIKEKKSKYVRNCGGDKDKTFYFRNFYNICEKCNGINEHIYLDIGSIRKSGLEFVPESNIESYYYKTLYLDPGIIRKVIKCLEENSI